MAAPVTLRHTGNSVVAGAVWLFCLVALVDGLLRGSTTYLLHAGLLLAAVALAAWLIFVRPRLVVRDDGLTIVNVLRTYDVPFDALISWRVGGVLTAEVATAGERVRKVVAWGAPGIRKQRPHLSSVLGRGRQAVMPVSWDGPGSSRSEAELVIEPREQQFKRGRPGNATIARIRWNWPQLLALVALIVTNVAVG